MSPAPGWYTDPNSSSQERFWDGAAWSGQTRPATTTAAAGPHDEGTPAPATGHPNAPAPRRTLLLAVGMFVAGMALVGGVALLLWPGDEQPPPGGTSPDADQSRETEQATDGDGEAGPTAEFAPPFDIAWRAEVACARGGFVTSAETAFVVTGEDCQDVTAIDLRDGSSRWDVATRSHEHDDEVSATLRHVIDGVVLANRDDPFGVPSEVTPRHLVTAIDEGTGDVLWHRGFTSSWSASPDGVFGPAMDGSFQGVDLRTGDVRWSYEPGGEERVLGLPVVSSDHVVVVVARPQETSSSDSPPLGDLVGLRTDDGAESWRWPADRTVRHLLAAGGAVLVGPPSGEAATLALNASSGERLWERTDLDMGRVRHVDEHLFIADGDRRFRLDPRTGEAVWDVGVGAGVLGASERHLFTTEVDVEFGPSDDVPADEASTIPEGETVGGTLTVDGVPVSGVAVDAFQDGEPVGTGASNADGEWVVQLPAAGTYEVALRVETLPPGVVLRAPDRTTLEIRVGEGAQSAALYALSYGDTHWRLFAYELDTGELAWDVDLGVGPHATRLLVDEYGFLLFGFDGTLTSWQPVG